MKIKNVVVIGSGTMGSGIAAHLCNANVPVTLLDLKTEISEKANNPPDITPGKIKGKVIFIKVLTGLLPRLAAALVTLWSNPDKVAVTVITTNGVPRIICARTIPVWVAAKPALAIKKNIATPEIINGTIIGDIKTAIIKPL